MSSAQASREGRAARDPGSPLPSALPSAGPHERAPRSRRRLLGWLVGLTALVIAIGLSITIGAKEISPQTAWDALTAFQDTDDHVIVVEMRLPRTVLAFAVGVALAVSGALLQGLTRNPLADPGILGVNAGAAFVAALAFGLLGVQHQFGIVAAAILGAIATTTIVVLLSRAQRGRAGVTGLILGGVAVGAVLSGLTSIIVLTDPQTFDQMRDWNAGSFSGRSADTITALVPFVAAGVVIAFAVGGSLNALALGDDQARALGVHIRRTRLLTIVAATLLCGAATAAAGPIAFVGLMVPHAVRWIAGVDQRWIMAYCVVWGPVLVMLSDVIGRVVVRPGEMPVGIVTAFVGGPVLVVLIRRIRVVQP